MYLHKAVPLLCHHLIDTDTEFEPQPLSYLQTWTRQTKAKCTANFILQTRLACHLQHTERLNLCGNYSSVLLSELCVLTARKLQLPANDLAFTDQKV